MSQLLGMNLSDSLKVLQTSNGGNAGWSELQMQGHPESDHTTSRKQGTASQEGRPNVESFDVNNASTLSAASFASLSQKMDQTLVRLQDRRVAETANFGAEGSPAVSLSLGLSSCSLHIPFATPGSVPQGDFITTLRQSLSGSGRGKSANAAGAAFDGQSSQRSTASGHSGKGIDVNESVMSMLHIQQMRDAGPPSAGTGSNYRGTARGLLFDMDSPQQSNTPLTPGTLPPRIAGRGVPGSASSILRNIAESDDIDLTQEGSTAALSMAAGTSTPGPRRHDGARARLHAPLTVGSITSINEDTSVEGIIDAPRRVSFGPLGLATERTLLFASGASNTEDAPSHSIGQQQEQTVDSTSPEENHPHKLQRLADLDGPGAGHPLGIADMSPIAVAHSPGLGMSRGRGHGYTPGHANNRGASYSAGADQNVANRAHDAAASGIAAGPSKERLGTGGGVPREPSPPSRRQGGAESGPRHPADVQDDFVSLSALLIPLASAYQLLSMYRCRECIALLHKIPKRQFYSAFVQLLLGRAYYEANDYKSTVLALKEMIRLEPFRLTGTETLSTALWHLKKDKELCALAQQVVEVDRTSPETWCVVGNCFSLLREPEGAMRFFQRALEIDKYFTYAHTLSGHEAAANEDLEKAAQFFRQAILCDERHYSAWYGLGSIYKRQERYELAEFHLRKALQINPSSGKLHCHLGIALHAQNTSHKNEEAHLVLTKACEIDVNNPQLHFQRAHVLLSSQRYEAALAELELVMALAPREPAVYVLMGQICQKLHRSGEALLHYNAALNLDPKEAAALKKCLDDIPDPDEEMESFESLSRDSMPFE